MAEKMDKSGFDYYLDLVQESKEQTRKDAPRKIFQVLQVNGGEMQLYQLISESLPKDADAREVDFMIETIQSLQEAELIVVEPMPEEEEKAAKSSESMIVRVTESGKKVMFSGFASNI